jgi:tetratricopeptide (TPR) repeat protein
VVRLRVFQPLLLSFIVGGLFVSACATVPRAMSNSGDRIRSLSVEIRQARFKGDIETCVRLSNEALAIAPMDTGLLGMRARCLAEFDRAVEAMADLRQIEVIGPASAVVLDDMALAYLALGRPGDAAVAARRAVAMQPSFEDAHFDLISALMATGAHQEAMAAFTAFQSSGLKDRIGVANNLSWELYLSGRYADALKIVEQWLAANPRVVEVKDHIGNAQGYATVLDTAAHIRAALGRADEAVSTFMRAAELSPHDLRPLYEHLLTVQGFIPATGAASLEPALRACVARAEKCKLYADSRRSGPIAPPK